VYVGADARSPELSSSKREESYPLSTTVGGGPGEPEHDVLAEVLEVFAPFAVRGTTPSRRYLEVLRSECPHVSGVAFHTAAMEAADWLLRPENGARTCCSAFIGNWVRKREREAAAAAPQKAKHPLLEGGARSAVGRALEYTLEHPPEVPSTWR